jgi:energy-coupling factor transporter transmembrane protein EcfT
MTDVRDILIDNRGWVYFIILIILITVGVGIGQMIFHSLFSSIGFGLLAVILFILIIYWYENNQNNNLIKF